MKENDEENNDLKLHGLTTSFSLLSIRSHGVQKLLRPFPLGEASL
jgi:hypothetical protein